MVNEVVFKLLNMTTIWKLNFSDDHPIIVERDNYMHRRAVDTHATAGPTDLVASGIKLKSLQTGGK